MSRRRTLQSVSLTRNWSALTGTTTYSNSTGDIGKTQYVEAAGGKYAIYSRRGTLLASVADTTFWSGLSGPDAAGLCATSPQSSQMVTYDRAGDRWVIAELAYAVDSLSKPTGPLVACVAVSASGDATSVYSRYVFQVSTSLYADFPSLGVWGDGYYLSFDEVTSSGSFLGAGALAVERSKMMTGAAAQARYFDLQNVTPRLGGMLPATNMSLSAPTGSEPYLQAHDDPTSINDRVEVWGFHVDWTAPVTGSTFQPVQNVPVNSFTSTFSCAKPGTTTTWSNCVLEDDILGIPTQELDPLSLAYSDTTDGLPRLGGRLAYTSSGGVETLTTALTINESSTAGAAWYQLTDNGSGWFLNDQGHRSGSADRFLPSAASDGSGDVALAYDISGGSTYFPTFAFTDPNDGAVGDVSLLAGSADHQGDAFWGRSTSLALDPVDLCTFWGVGPATSGHTSWATEIGAFKNSGCTAAAAQPPLLTGDPAWTAPLVREGLTINGSAGTWSSTPAVTVTHVWRRCDLNGLNCVDITGATGSSYTMTATDAVGDRTLRYQETATSSDGTSVAVSQPTTLVQSIPPVNTVLPVISGIVQQGSTLSSTSGTWTSSSPLSYTYRWRRCASGTCATIAGATASSYTLTSADVNDTVDVIVSATNTGGGTDANAAATSTIQPLTPPANTALPVVSGTAQDGSALSVSTGTWTSMTPVTFAYRWYRCDALAVCTVIAGATGSTYTLVTADVGSTMQAVVAASNSGGSTDAYAALTTAVVSTPPANTVAPVISGTARSGQTLSTTNGTWTSSSPLTYTYQWRRCTNGTCSAISGGTANSYTLQPADVGSTVDVIVGATNSGGTTFSNASATAAIVAAAPQNVSQPAVFGTPQVGSTLSSTNGTWSSAFPVTFTYQWKRCSSGVCSDITGANAASYALVSADAAHSVQLVVTATSIGGSTPSTSPQSAIIAAAASGGGGGGGGGGGTPDLKVEGFATPLTPLPGDSVTLAYVVTDKNLAPATKLVLTVTLPAGVSFISGVTTRGPGCVAGSGTTVLCNLDYLSSDSPTANVYVYGKVTASGSQTVVASAASDLGDLTASDNSLSLTLNAATATTSGAPSGLNGGGTTSTTKTDKKAPASQALQSSGKRGGTARLRFKIYDDSGVAKAVATVKRNGKAVATAKSGFGPVAYGSVYYVGWRVPRAAPKGRYTFCVAALDRAAHHSKTTCAPLALK